MNVEKVELTYNGRGKKVFEGQALEKATNTTGLMSMIDVYLYQKKKDLLIIQGLADRHQFVRAVRNHPARRARITKLRTLKFASPPALMFPAASSL